ncbi:MAG: hypothetical protein ACXWB4_06245 [Kaistella sp.]
MDNNKFQQSQDFKNVERNVNNNPDHNIENSTDSTTRLKDVRNPEITQENFVKDAENAIPPQAWDNQKKAYDDAWENNKDQQLGEEV